MDEHLFKLISDEIVPNPNPFIMEGMAYHQMKPAQVMQFIDRLLRCVESQFPPGFTYVRTVRCQPGESYAERTRARSTPRGGVKRRYDLARRDTYMVKCLFEYNGRNLRPGYLDLLDIRRGGRFALDGKDWHTSPVLADRCISVTTQNSIFLPVLRAKIKVTQATTFVMVNGKVVEVSSPYSFLHHRKTAKGKTPTSESVKLTVIKPMLAHNLFCRFGVAGTFEKYANTPVVIVNVRDANSVNYPPDKYVVIQSSGNVPEAAKFARGTKIEDRAARRCEVALVIPKEKYVQGGVVETLTSGFFYVADHFPEWINLENAGNNSHWRMLLGHIYWGDESYAKLVEGIDRHMDSLDEYVDLVTAEVLRMSKIEVDNIFDLMAYLIENLPKILIVGYDRASSVFNKKLSVHRYLLSDIIGTVFNFSWALSSAAARKLTPEIADRLISKWFQTKVIDRIKSSTDVDKVHGEVAIASSPGDCMYMKLTSVMVTQENATSRSNEVLTIKPSDLMDPSMMLVGSVRFLPKANPCAVTRANPFLEVDRTTGDIVFPTEFKELIDEAYTHIR